MAVLWLAVALQLACTVESERLVFPPGTDVGYIVPGEYLKLSLI